MEKNETNHNQSNSSANSSDLGVCVVRTQIGENALNFNDWLAQKSISYSIQLWIKKLLLFLRNIIKFDSSDMNVDFNKALESASKIKLKGGIFTKSCLILLIAIIAIFIMACVVNNIWVFIGAGVFIFVLVLVILLKLISLAGKNPHAVIFEGAELLIHSQMQMHLMAKGLGKMEGLPSQFTEALPTSSDPDKIKEANNPDPEKTKD